MGRIVLLLVAVALVVSACGDDAESTTTSAAPGTTVSVTPTTAPVTATTPPTTSPATTTSSTTSSTTIPIDPGTYVVTSGICLLGWWDGTDWQTGDSPPVAGGEPYQVVRLDEAISTSTGSAPGPFCDPLDLVNVELDPDPSVDYFALDPIAIQTGSDVRPQSVELLGTGQQAYIDATTDLLEVAGLVDPPINIEQVIRVDLEGDGTDEVIVAASTVDPTNFLASDPGDYTLVYLRKLIEGEVQTAILVREVFGEADLVQGLIRYRVSAVADLNGDGKMEIVLSSEAWEGASLEAWEYVNDDLGPVFIMGCGCGS